MWINPQATWRRTREASVNSRNSNARKRGWWGDAMMGEGVSGFFSDQQNNSGSNRMKSFVETKWRFANSLYPLYEMEVSQNAIQARQLLFYRAKGWKKKTSFNAVKSSCWLQHRASCYYGSKISLFTVETIPLPQRDNLYAVLVKTHIQTQVITGYCIKNHSAYDRRPRIPEICIGIMVLIGYQLFKLWHASFKYLDYKICPHAIQCYIHIPVMHI